MKCLRCGYCCIHYFVPIVIDPEKGLAEDNITVHLGNGRCPHLRGDKSGEYSCAVHDKSWYDQTPCSDFGQIEAHDSPCRIGTYFLAKELKVA